MTFNHGKCTYSTPTQKGELAGCPLLILHPTLVFDQGWPHFSIFVKMC